LYNIYEKIIKTGNGYKDILKTVYIQIRYNESKCKMIRIWIKMQNDSNLEKNAE